MNHYIFNIIRDPEPQSPREVYSTFGTMTCWSKYHTLGDDQPHESKEDWICAMVGMDDDQVAHAIDREYAKLRAGYSLPITRHREASLRLDAWKAVVSRCEERFYQKYVVLPLYLYDHSGITISTAPFSCPWDSGQVGFISVSKAKVREEFGIQRITAKVREKAEEILRGEVKDYDQYLQGEVWAFEIKELPELPELLDRLGVSELTEEDDIQEIHESFPIEGSEDFETFDSCYGFYDEEECRRQAKIALAAAEAGHAQRIARQHGQLELTI